MSEGSGRDADAFERSVLQTDIDQDKLQEVAEVFGDDASTPSGDNNVVYGGQAKEDRMYTSNSDNKATNTMGIIGYVINGDSNSSYKDTLTVKYNAKTGGVSYPRQATAAERKNYRKQKNLKN